MLSDQANPGRYCGLDKSHKEKDSRPVGQHIPPLSPVVSASGSVSEGISHWVDEQVKKLDSYLEDTRHVLDVIREENSRGPQPPGTIPVTLDIGGMYTNVPLEQGLHAFEASMNMSEDQTIPTEFLVRLMEFVCTSNVFVFDNRLFLQLLGVAMGSRSSPTFACIFMGMLEVLMLFNWSQTGEQMPYLWKPGESYNFSTRAINFLDLTIWIDDAGYIQTTLYSKPCRVVSYLLPSSHPSHICNNIPYSLAYRLKRIESLSDKFEQNLAVLKSELVSRGYNSR